MPRHIAGDVSIAYEVMGEGEDLVLIHGLGANMAFWYMGIARILASQFRVITYDLRGHGRSSMPPSGYHLPGMAADLSSLLDHLDVEKAHIVGHSFGARVALHFTLRASERVQSLTIADTQVSCLQSQVKLADWPHWKNWKKQLQAQGFDSLPPEDEHINFEMLQYFNQLSNEFTHGSLNRKRPAGHRPSLKKRDMGRKGAARWDRLMGATTAKKDFGDDCQITDHRVQHLKVPTLAMFGELSHCIPSCQSLEKYIDHCEVTILPEVGHFHPAVKPRLFTQTLLRFLQQHQTTVEGATPIRRKIQSRDRRQSAGNEVFPMADRFGNPVTYCRRAEIEREDRRRTDGSVYFPFRDRHGVHVAYDRRRGDRRSAPRPEPSTRESAPAHGPLRGRRLRVARRRFGGNQQ